MSEEEENPTVESMERNTPSPVEPYNPESPQVGLSFEKKPSRFGVDSPPRTSNFSFPMFPLPPLPPNFLNFNGFLPPPPPLPFIGNNNINGNIGNFNDRFSNKPNGGGARPDHLLYLTGGESPRQSKPHRNHRRHGPYNGGRPYDRPSNHHAQGKNNGGGYYNIDSPTSRLILLKRVPLEMNKMDLLDNHFSKYGKINCIEICHKNDPCAAIIEFASPFDAKKVYRSTEPVFENRFIKVFWGANVNFEKIANGKPNNPPQNWTAPSNAQNRLLPAFTPSKPNSVSSAKASQHSSATSPPIPNISTIEREKLRKELIEEHKELSETMANKDMLLKKMNNAKTAEEKAKIKGLIVFTMKKAEELSKTIKSKYERLSLAQRTVKVYTPNVVHKAQPSAPAPFHLSHPLPSPSSAASNDFADDDVAMNQEEGGHSTNGSASNGNQDRDHHFAAEDDDEEVDEDEEFEDYEKEDSFLSASKRCKWDDSSSSSSEEA